MVRSIGREPHTPKLRHDVLRRNRFRQVDSRTYEAVPWGWYPTAGDPNKTTKRVEIPELSESLDEMAYVTGMVEGYCFNPTERAYRSKETSLSAK